MSNPVLRFAIARENGYFKVEQEADIQRHRKRLINQGEIEEIAGGSFGPRRQQNFEESAATFEVLAEVLQQQARLDDPGAAARQEFERKVRGALPALTDAEMARYRSALYGVAAAVGHVPRVSLAGRNRYSAIVRADPEGGSGARPPAQRSAEAWTPAQREAARRAYMAGARSLLYGSALGLGGVMLVGSAALRYADVASPDEFRARMRAYFGPFADSVQHALLPFKAHVKGALASWFGFEAGEGGGGPEDTEFTSSLRRRLHRRMGAQLPGGIVALERGSSDSSAGALAESPAEAAS